MKKLFKRLVVVFMSAMFAIACGGPVHDSSEPMELANMAGLEKADRIQTFVDTDSDNKRGWLFYFWCEEEVDGCAMKLTLEDYSWINGLSLLDEGYSYILDVEISNSVPTKTIYTKQIEINSNNIKEIELLIHIPYKRLSSTLLQIRPSNAENIENITLSVTAEWENLLDNKLGRNGFTWVPESDVDEGMYLGTDPTRELYINHNHAQKPKEHNDLVTGWVYYTVEFEGKDNWYGNETIELVPQLMTENHPDFGECTPSWWVFFTRYDKDGNYLGSLSRDLPLDEGPIVLFEEKENLLRSDSGFYTIAISPIETCAYDTELLVYLYGLK